MSPSGITGIDSDYVPRASPFSIEMVRSWKQQSALESSTYGVVRIGVDIDFETPASIEASIDKVLLHGLWLYLIAPVIGAALAIIVYRYLASDVK